MWLPWPDPPIHDCSQVNIDTTFLRRCIASLEAALEGIERHHDDDNDELMYDIYRAACVKEFELVLEQNGKLLRKLGNAKESAPLQRETEIALARRTYHRTTKSTP